VFGSLPPQTTSKPGGLGPLPPFADQGRLVSVGHAVDYSGGGRFVSQQPVPRTSASRSASLCADGFSIAARAWRMPTLALRLASTMTSRPSAEISFFGILSEEGFPRTRGILVHFLAA